MQTPRLQRRNGIALVVASAVAWSTSALFTRLLHLDSWTILFWRGLFGGAAIAAFLLLSGGWMSLRHLLNIKRGGWLVACLSTLAMISFVPALQLTSVANVSIIIAAQPFAAAGIAWIWLREAASKRTIVASLITLLGVALVVQNAYGAQDYRGILLACLMMVAVAAMTVTMRRYKETSMVASTAISNFLSCLISLPLANNLFGVTQTDFILLALFSVIAVAIGFICLSLGSRLLPAAETALIATLETPLMPLWAWLMFQETPSRWTILGGILVLGAVVADIVGGDYQGTRRPIEATGRDGMPS